MLEAVKPIPAASETFPPTMARVPLMLIGLLVDGDGGAGAVELVKFDIEI